MELHPLCTLFPRMAGDEYAKLCDDIKTNGLKHAIATYDGMILDGGNRYRACLDVGIEPSFIEFDGSDIVAFVLSMNFHRRHLSPGQQAQIVAIAQNWSSAQTVGRPNGATLHHLTVADRAAQSGASIRTQKMADKVARENPQLAEMVGHGEIILPKAHAQVTPSKAQHENGLTQTISTANLSAQREPEPEEPEYSEYDQLHDELIAARDEIKLLTEENEALRRMISAGDTSDDARREHIDFIRERDRQHGITAHVLAAAKSQRDAYMNENAAMKRQMAAQRREIDKLKAAQNA